MERCWTGKAGGHLCSPKLCVTKKWCHVSPPAGPAVGLWVCLKFGGEDSGDGSLCGRRRNKQVPLLYHLPDEPGECWDHCAFSQFTQVLVLLRKRVGWKASSGERAYFARVFVEYLALWGPQLWCCSLPVLVPSTSGRLCSLSHMTCCCSGCSRGWCCLWTGQHGATPALSLRHCCLSFSASWLLWWLFFCEKKNSISTDFVLGDGSKPVDWKIIKEN